MFVAAFGSVSSRFELIQICQIVLLEMMIAGCPALDGLPRTGSAQPRHGRKVMSRRRDGTRPLCQVGARRFSERFCRRGRMGRPVSVNRACTLLRYPHLVHTLSLSLCSQQPSWSFTRTAELQLP